MYWVYDLPNWLFGLLTVSTFVLLTIVGFEVTHRLGKSYFSQHERAPERNSMVGQFFGASVGLYGITLGLISVGAWQTYSDTDSKAGAEAASVAALYRDVGAYPEPARSALKTSVKEYCQSVIRDAWPLQRKGIIPSVDTKKLDVVEEQLHRFEPQTPGQVATHQEALGQFNKLIELRRRRLQTVTSGLPGAVWGVVVLGALISMSLTWLFLVEHRKMHRLLVSLHAALIGLLVFLMAAMDNPYRGEFSVGTDAFQQVLEHLM
jgi:Protein of unknown function (DUF4239)